MAKTPKNFKKADILKAIEGSKGMYSVIAKNLIKITGIYCCRNTAERNVHRFPECEQAIQDEIESIGDFIEMKGFELVSKGDGAMIRYYLSTKFRKRGYDLNEAPSDNKDDSEETVNEIEITDTVDSVGVEETTDES